MMIRKSVWASAVAVCAAAGFAAACAGSPVAPDAGMTMMSAGGGGALQSRAPAKVDICHVNGTGEYRKITVGAPAEPAHLAHGDARPGDPAPAPDGGGSASGSHGGFWVFDENCAIVPGTPPCGGSAETSGSSGGC